MSQLLALSLYSRFLRCASTSKTFVLQVIAMTTNKGKAVTVATVHGKKINKTALL